MDTVTLTIDGRAVTVERGATVLEAAQAAGIYIPTLCSHPDLKPFGGCRLCVVEIERMRGMPTSCTVPADNGMVVRTDTDQVRALRRDVLEMILAEHPSRCLDCERLKRCSPGDICLRDYEVTQRCIVCPKNGNCELQRIVDYIGIEKITLPVTTRGLPILADNPFFERDYNLCVLCGRCVRVCQEVRGINAIAFTYRGNRALIGTAFDVSLKDAGCRFCFACVEVCPTGAIMDKAEKYRTLSPAEKEAHVVPCSNACPLHLDVPRYLRLAGEGRFEEALAVIREDLPFVNTLGLVCFHPCEANCRRGQLDEPLSIRAIKRLVAEQADTHQTWGVVAEPSGKKVAVIGSGPAGLAAAYYLRKLGGHAVTIFEALPMAGGMMRVGIPRYRLPAAVLDADIAVVTRLGVELRLNTRVESVDALLQEGYDAVVLASGAHLGQRIGVPGEDSPGVMDCVTLLRAVSLGEPMSLGNRVAVVGGGNAAMDAARTALRLGCKEVNIVYRRSRGQAPADPMEIAEAIHEGVNFMWLTNPSRIATENGVVKMECIRQRLGEPDASGRPRPEPIPGSEFVMEVDNVIAAIGQASDIPAGFGVRVGRGNVITADPATMATNRPGVFAAGDVVTGPATVTEAIAAGKRAAAAIDRYLGGSGDIVRERLIEAEANNPYFGMADAAFMAAERPEMAALEVAERLVGFAEVEHGYDAEAGRAECARCQRCDIRLTIRQVAPPPAVEKKLPLEIRG